MTDPARYPLVQAFCEGAAKLTTEQAMAATRDERIKSVGYFMLRQINSFASTMRPRERANFDVEDMWTELYTVVAKQDHKWDPATATYLTFVGMLVAHELEEIRNKSRTVQSPRNASLRLRAYAESRANGSLSQRSSVTDLAIRRTISDPERSFIEGSKGETSADAFLASNCEPPEVQVADKEDSRQNRIAMGKALARLDHLTASMIRMLYGLKGDGRVSIGEIAERSGVSYREAKRIIRAGLKELREILSGDEPGE